MTLEAVWYIFSSQHRLDIEACHTSWCVYDSYDLTFISWNLCSQQARLIRSWPTAWQDLMTIEARWTQPRTFAKLVWLDQALQNKCQRHFESDMIESPFDPWRNKASCAPTPTQHKAGSIPVHQAPSTSLQHAAIVSIKFDLSLWTKFKLFSSIHWCCAFVKVFRAVPMCEIAEPKGLTVARSWFP